MKNRFIIVCLLILTSVSSNAQKLDGVWQGLITFQTKEYKKSNVLYLDIKISGEEVEGFARVESVAHDYYAYKSIYGNIKDSVLKFRDVQILKSKNEFKKDWCLHQYEIQFDPKTAYLKGTYKSDECKFDYGHIIMYRSKEKLISKTDSSLLDKKWRNKFLSDLKRGKPAPELMEKQMKNFIFQPVNFDHDSSIVKSEYHAYLKELADIVESHSDLRIKIIGHTDAVGSNEYNIGLSKRRAEAIKLFLTKLGLSEDRIEIEYKGEAEPIGTNNTNEGKAQNRRVDVIFI